MSSAPSLRTQSTALILYGVLLVLPTLVLGGLQWRQILGDKDAELAAVPRLADDAARRFRETLRERVEALIRFEEERPFEYYARFFCPEAVGPEGEPRVTFLPSPLGQEARPPGLLCWFVFDMADLQVDEAPPENVRIDLFWGAGEVVAEEDEDFHAAVRKVMMWVEDNPMRAAGRLGDFNERSMPLSTVAANRATGTDRACLEAQRELLCSGSVDTLRGEFFLEMWLEDDGTPRVVATRRVLVPAMPELQGLNPCLHAMSRGLGLVQGFFIDPNWLFGELPRSVARTTLDTTQQFVPIGAAQAPPAAGEYQVTIHAVDELAMETEGDVPPGFGAMKISIDTNAIEARFRRRATRFFGVAAMLALTLGTGLALMLRSVRQDLERAQRTENFVSAVTHELRTPLSSIQLHGEMLLDGWAKDPDKQRTYYRRIVRETERLSTMVERVLEKGRLASGRIRPVAGDLSDLVEERVGQLESYGEGEESDLEFRLADGLPPVMLTTEAVTSILVNLVENARKYAPVDTTDPKAERIVVETRLRGRDVVLEVKDRGPGISPQEAQHVFEAFYRVGNEATRTSRGTGLGLHLVALQAEAIGARIEVERRKGGGARFRLTFARAPLGDPHA